MEILKICFPIIFLLLSLSRAEEQVPSSLKNFTSLAEALEDAEKHILHLNETYNLPSIAFGLSVKGKSVIRKTWGYADLENLVPAQISTRYRIASISKTFTSLLVGQFVDKNLLSYDDPISKYLPETVYPSTKDWASGGVNQRVNITLRQLLSHTAGVHVTDVVKDFFHITIVENVTQTIAQFKDEPLYFKPGAGFAYSNYGFQLLGATLESVTSKPFPVILTEFFEQNHLKSSYVGNLYTILHDSARHYMSKSEKEPKENVPSLLEETFYVEGYWPAGGVVTNVDDLLHYGQLLIDAYHGRNSVISRKTLDQMWSYHTHQSVNPYFLPGEYGLGWCVTNPGANNSNYHAHQKVVWHGGGLPGVSTMLMIYPEEEVVGVVLLNKGGVLGLDEAIVRAVENVYKFVK